MGAVSAPSVLFFFELFLLEGPADVSAEDFALADFFVLFVRVAWGDALALAVAVADALTVGGALGETVAEGEALTAAGADQASATHGAAKIGQEIRM